jgi:hypothetical protein
VLEESRAGRRVRMSAVVCVIPSSFSRGVGEDEIGEAEGEDEDGRTVMRCRRTE